LIKVNVNKPARADLFSDRWRWRCPNNTAVDIRWWSSCTMWHSSNFWFIDWLLLLVRHYCRHWLDIRHCRTNVMIRFFLSWLLIWRHISVNVLSDTDNANKKCKKRTFSVLPLFKYSPFILNIFFYSSQQFYLQHSSSRDDEIV